MTQVNTMSSQVIKTSVWVCMLLTFNGERFPHSEQFALRVDGDLKVQEGFVHDESIQGRRICPSPPTHKHRSQEWERSLNWNFWRHANQIYFPNFLQTCAETPYLGLSSRFVIYTEDEINCILIHCVNTYIIT